jgi:hypothetical protein
MSEKPKRHNLRSESAPVLSDSRLTPGTLDYVCRWCKVRVHEAAFGFWQDEADYITCAGPGPFRLHRADIPNDGSEMKS